MELLVFHNSYLLFQTVNLDLYLLLFYLNTSYPQNNKLRYATVVVKTGGLLKMGVPLNYRTILPMQLNVKKRFDPFIIEVTRI